MELKDRQVRLARRDDADAIARMSRDLIEHGLKWRWTADRVGAAIADPNINCLLTTHSGLLSGFSITQFGDSSAHLALLAVHPQYQRRGIGDYLVRWQELAAVTAGIQRISLEVRCENKGAIDFYHTLGFKICGRLRNYYESDEDALRMSRAL